MNAASCEEQMLPRVVRPIDGENVIGLIGRLTDAMCAPFPAVLKFLGIRSDFMLSEAGWEKLGWSLGLDQEAFAGMRREQVVLGRESGGVRMLGHVLRYYLIVRGTLRICPTCVATGQPMLERWDLAHVPTCFRHGCLLVDTCSCGQKLSRRYRGTRTAFSCPCGVRFADLPTTPATAALLTLTRMVEAVLEGEIPDGLNPALALLPLSDLLCLVHVVGLALVTPAELDEPVTPRGAVYNSIRLPEAMDDVATIAALAQAAVPVLLDWENGYPQVLAQVAGRNTDAGVASADAIFATRIGRMLRRPFRGIDKIPLPPMTVAVERFCEERHGVKSRKGSVRRDSPVARKMEPHMTRRRIALEIGVGSQDPLLSRLYDQVVRGLDEEGIAPTLTAKALAAKVRKEVLRRWSNSRATMSADQVARYLSHPLSTHTPDHWIHPDLLVPVDAAKLGVDDTLAQRRRGISFLASDVEALRDRIAAQTRLVASEDELDGFEPFGRCRKFHGGGWPRQDFLLAFLRGRIEARTLVDRPRITDIWFHLETVRDLSFEHRVLEVIRKDPFAVAYRCRALLEDLWGAAPIHLTDFHLRHLRHTNGVRYEDVRNTTNGRDRPLYHYSMVDILERERLLRGASLTRLVDQAIDAHRATRDPATRIVVDEDQARANDRWRRTADSARRSLGGPTKNPALRGEPANKARPDDIGNTQNRLVA